MLFLSLWTQEVTFNSFVQRPENMWKNQPAKLWQQRHSRPQLPMCLPWKCPFSTACSFNLNRFTEVCWGKPVSRSTMNTGMTCNNVWIREPQGKYLHLSSPCDTPHTRPTPFVDCVWILLLPRTALLFGRRFSVCLFVVIWLHTTLFGNFIHETCGPETGFFIQGLSTRLGHNTNAGRT